MSIHLSEGLCRLQVAAVIKLAILTDLEETTLRSPSNILFCHNCPQVSDLFFDLAFDRLSITLPFHWLWRVVVVDPVCGLRSCVPRQKDLAALIVCWFRHYRLHIVLVIVVPFKQLLHTVASQLGLAFLYGFCIFPLLVIYMIGIEVVDLDVGNVG